MPAAPQLRVTFVGRPNVGKSSLFNRIVGRHEAITADEAGTTRDRVERQASFARGVSCLLTDVGGIESVAGDSIEADIQAQVREAVSRSDLVIFVVDAKAPLTSDDVAAADLLRRSRLPFLFIANKWESGNQADLAQFAELGLGLPMGVSALHMAGFDAFMSATAKQLRQLRREKKATIAALPEDITGNIALIGRPNVGKSTLLNQLTGEARAIVSATPLTTRDTNDAIIEREDLRLRVLDTAGLRRRGQIGKGIDRFATGRTLNAISEADVALLMLDGDEGLTAQDAHVAEKALDAGCGLILVVNKIDSWADDEEVDMAELRDRWLRSLAHRFHFLSWAPVIMISAKTGRNVEHLFPVIQDILAQRKQRIQTRKLNLFFQKIMAEHPPTRVGTRVQPKIYFVTQAETSPPTFVMFVNKQIAFHFSYRRYIVNRLREEYGFTGTPVVLELREKKRGEEVG